LIALLYGFFESGSDAVACISLPTCSGCAVCATGKPFFGYLFDLHHRGHVVEQVDGSAEVL
jgi:hypothetical protein